MERNWAMIKLINYLPYGVMKEEYISKSSIDNMCRESKFKGGEFTNVCMNGGYHLCVKETPEEILAMPDIEEGSKAIDWEERRYEIAKDITAAIYTRPNVKGTLLNYNQIVAAADGLIRELKKGGEK